MKKLILLSFILAMLACNTKTKEVEVKVDSITIDTIYVDSVKIDSLKKLDKPVELKKK